jgi:hypothetical protein
MHKNIVGNLWNDTIVAKCLLKVLDFGFGVFVLDFSMCKCFVL